ncbi:serine/threonine-protein kinase [Streptomyces sp. NPDC060006]|uniref:serine/threonine-protein kinase n=1 Tax=unclassified Streptomyces TaxID=2593676 RepID=UPI003681A39A
MPLEEAAPSQPLCVGRYRLGRRVGSGGQGTVYEAYDPEGARVALKLLHATEAEGSEAAQRLIKEVEVTQRVAVACTARLIEAVVHGPRPHVVNEFIDGPTLRAAVDEHGPFRGEDLHRLALAVAVALCGIHDAQVVHRDLKPDNVLLGCSGPVVIDFGVARLLDLTATQPAGLAGTPACTAPEVFDGKPAGPSADVFAWGATVLFAATGRDPFGGEHLGHTVSLVRGGRHDRSMLSEPLRSLVGAALDPVNRPSAMGLLYRLTSRPGGPCGKDGEVAVLEGTRQARLLRPPVGSSGPLLPLGDIAEHVFAGLSTAEQDSAREVFLRMVVPADDRTGVSDTVRTVALEELSDADSPGRAASVRGVLTAFTAAGLLIRGDGEVSGVAVRNSALVVAWPRLRSWISDDREGLRIHRPLGEGARSWQGHGRKDDALVQGTELERTVEWSTTAPAHMRLSSLEQAYLATAQRVGRRRRAQRRRLTVTALVLAFLAVVSATVAWNINTLSEERRTRLQREQIESAARRAASRAEALRRWDPLTARLLNVAAWQIAHSRAGHRREQRGRHPVFVIGRRHPHPVQHQSRCRLVRLPPQPCELLVEGCQFHLLSCLQAAQRGHDRLHPRAAHQAEAHDPIDPRLCALYRAQLPLVFVLQVLQLESVACPHLFQPQFVQAQLFLQPGIRLGLPPLEPQRAEPPYEPWARTPTSAPMRVGNAFPSSIGPSWRLVGHSAGEMAEQGLWMS